MENCVDYPKSSLWISVSSCLKKKECASAERDFRLRCSLVFGQSLHHMAILFLSPHVAGMSSEECKGNTCVCKLQRRLTWELGSFAVCF